VCIGGNVTYATEEDEVEPHGSDDASVARLLCTKDAGGALARRNYF
jgi:hypothetical protein